MKVKIELEPNETIEQAEDFLAKSLAAKSECTEERYSDDYLNEFHDYICQRHQAMVSNIIKEIEQEILGDAYSKGHF